MNTSASRGAILIVVAVIVGAIVLGQGFDSTSSTGVISAQGGDSTGTGSDTDTPEVTRNPDGTAIAEVDLDGDGTLEWAIDTDGDDVVDKPAIDTDGDDVVDTAVDDTGGDGSSDVPFTPDPHDPASVKVIVANGTNVNGLAGTVSTSLSARNYQVLDATNADTVETTTIYYEADYEADALLVANYLSANPDQVQELPASGDDPAGVDRRGAQVLVVLGNDEVSQSVTGTEG